MGRERINNWNLFFRKNKQYGLADALFGAAELTAGSIFAFVSISTDAANLYAKFPQAHFLALTAFRGVLGAVSILAALNGAQRFGGQLFGERSNDLGSI